jgi:hypothetical protein
MDNSAMLTDLYEPHMMQVYHALGAQARPARAVLGEGRCGATRIVTGGNLDDYSIATLAGRFVPIDVLGVGMAPGASVGHPPGLLRLVTDADRRLS